LSNLLYGVDYKRGSRAGVGSLLLALLGLSGGRNAAGTNTNF